MKYLTDTRFLAGLAIGYFAVPLIVKHGRMQLERLRPASTNASSTA